MKENTFASFEEMLANTIGPLIHKIDHSIYLKHNHIFLSHGITFQQGVILVFLYHNSHKTINQKAIEAHMELKGPSVTSLVQKMVEKGYIQRLQDKKDARNYKLELTEKGVALYAICDNIFFQINKVLIKDITEDEIDILRKLLKRMVKNIEE